MASSNQVVCVFLMCIVVAAPLITEAALTCGQIKSGLVPCLAYLQKGGFPTPGCCGGIKGLIRSAMTKADRQNACNCLKTVAGQIKTIKPANAAKLPSLCGANIPYKISTSTNCASVK